MASAPKTQGYTLAASKGKLAGKPSVSLIKSPKQFLKWTGKGPTKSVSQVMTENRDRVLRTRPLAALTTQVANARHSRDMERLGATPSVGPVIGHAPVTSVRQLGNPIKNAAGKHTGKFEWNRGENVFAENPRLREASVYVRDSKTNKIVLAPNATAPQGVGRPGTRPRSGPQLDDWKSHAVEYNGALSRQQAFNPSNHILAAIRPLRVSTKDMAEIPVTKLYVSRGGRGNTVTPPPGKNHPTTQIV